MQPKEWLQSFLRGRGVPVLSFLNDDEDEYLSAANLYNLAQQLAKSIIRNKKNFSLINISDKDSLVEFFGYFLANKTCFIGQDIEAHAAESFLKSLQKSGSMSSVSGGLVLKTSGSSQRGPRFVFLSWSQVIEQVEIHAAHFNFTKGMSRLSILSKNHGFGLVLDLLVGLRLEQTISIGFDPSKWTRSICSLVVEKEIDFIALTPRLAWLFCLQAEKAKMNHRIHLHLGGACLETDLKVKIKNLGWNLIEGYGLTECGPGVLINGEPLSGIEIEVRSRFGDIGELWVKTRTLGWFEDVEVDERGFFFSGDLAVVEDGNLRVLGRIGDLQKLADGTWTTKTELEAKISEEFHLSVCRLIRDSMGRLKVWGFSTKWNDRISEKLTNWLLRRLGVAVLVQVESDIQKFTHELENSIGKVFEGPKEKRYDVAG